MVNTHEVPIAVIGGSGLYNLDNLEVIEEVNPETVSYQSGIRVRVRDQYFSSSS